MNESSQTTSLTHVEGDVKWFDPRRGYGFIVGPEGQDIFVHFSQIDGEGFRVLKDGRRVVYNAELTDRGWHATWVRRLDEGEVRTRPVSPRVRNPRRH